MVLSPDPDTILVPSGENTTDMTYLLWSLVFSFSSSSLSARTSQQASVSAKKGRFECSGAPESQTLIVPPLHAVTILVPSGENATELIPRLCALIFSLSSSRLPARQANRRQFVPKGGAILRAPAHQNPRL